MRYLAAVATHPDEPLRSVTVGWRGREPARAAIGELAPSAAERRVVATAGLEAVVDLRDRGLREPLPLTSQLLTQ